MIDAKQYTVITRSFLDAFKLSIPGTSTFHHKIQTVFNFLEAINSAALLSRIERGPLACAMSLETAGS